MDKNRKAGGWADTGTEAVRLVRPAKVEKAGVAAWIKARRVTTTPLARDARARTAAGRQIMVSFQVK